MLSKRVLSSVACGWALVLCAGTSMALAQESLPPQADETELADVPTDLPGHEEGPRRKDTPKPVVPAPADGAEGAPEAGAGQPADADVAEAPQDPEWFGGKPWWEWSRATGNWGGLRTDLSSLGFEFNGSYTVDWGVVFDGGVDTDSSYQHILDFNLLVDFEKLFSIEGGSMFVDFYSTSGESLSADAGDFAFVSDIENTEHDDQVAELWYQQWLFDRLLRVKVGKIEANSEFNFWQLADDFVNSAAGFSPTLVGFTTYPNPAVGANVFVYPTSWLYAGAGFYDGATADGFQTGGRGLKTFFSDDDSSSWSVIGEIGLTAKQLGFLRTPRLAFGGIGHTADFARFDGEVEEGTQGFYAIAEAMVCKRAEEDDSDLRGLSVVTRYGWADEEISSAANHLAGGLSLRGTFEGRNDDFTGLLVSWVDLSDDDAAGFESDETVIEFFYKIQITPWMSVKPDLQYVINPSGREDIDDAVVGILRVEVSF
jgi:porin